MNAIDGAFKTLFGDLSGPDGAKKLEAVVIDLTGDVKAMISWFEEAWPDIKTGAEAVWAVMKEIAREVGQVVEGWTKIVGLYHDIKSGQVFTDIADTIKGEHGGISTDVVNENSPAWKKARAAGLPAFAAGGVVDGPTLALIGEEGPEAVVPLGRSFGSLPDSVPAGFGGVPSITYAPQFHFGGAGGDVAQQIEAFEQQHRAALKSFIDEVRANVGAA